MLSKLWSVTLVIVDLLLSDIMIQYGHEPLCKCTQGFVASWICIAKTGTLYPARLLTQRVASKPSLIKPECFQGLFESALTIFKATET